MKKYSALLLIFIMIAVAFSGCGNLPSTNDNSSPHATDQQAKEIYISLSDDAITVDGQSADSDGSKAIYIANDIICYESGRDHSYGEGSEADAHTVEEAASHTVVHISKPGRYVLSGTLSRGQIAVDLGNEAENDPKAVVTLVLNGVDIGCSVAPAVIFYNVYECGNTDVDSASRDVDTSAAGANVIIADGSENRVSGSYVARIYKPESVVLNDDGSEVLDAKKLHKYDGAFYSKMSMNIGGGELGSGSLFINAENEGLGSELHLTINGGNISIVSGNDGINTNEDNVSVTTVNGGTLNIIANGATGEGDGIDSNGWLVINGGTVFTQGCATSGDAGIDSDLGIHINGGSVFASGNMLDRISDSEQNYAVFQFADSQKGGVYSLRNANGNTVAECEVANSFIYLVISSAELTEGEYTLWRDGEKLGGIASEGGMGGMMPGTMPPDGFEHPQGVGPPAMPGEDIAPPDGMEAIAPPERMDEPKPPAGGSFPVRPATGGGDGTFLDTFHISKGGNYFTSVRTTE